MRIPTHPYRCPLGRMQPEPVDVQAVKRDGWRDQGILVVHADDDSLDMIEREIVRRIGVRLYGHRQEARDDG